MPTAFPRDEFRAFLNAASRFFPQVLSDEYMLDTLERTPHFQWSWQAVRFRYRTCAETADEFQALVSGASEEWLMGVGQDEELLYRLERCIYIFFMNALSVFESFAFALYFLGAALRPDEFPGYTNPKQITMKATLNAYKKAFPQAPLYHRLTGLCSSREFGKIDELRNVLAHRLSGRRSVQENSRLAYRDKPAEHSRKEWWYMPGTQEYLTFSADMLHADLKDITAELCMLVTAAREFAEQQ